MRPSDWPPKFRLILAASASGKTHLVARAPSTFLDGDTIIEGALGWPGGRWWEGPRADEWHLAHAHALAAVGICERLHDRPRIILFNGDPLAIHTVFTNLGMPIAVWVTTPARLFRNGELRGADGKPKLPPELAGNWHHLKSFAETAHVPILTDSMITKLYDVPVD